VSFLGAAGLALFVMADCEPRLAVNALVPVSGGLVELDWPGAGLLVGPALFGPAAAGGCVAGDAAALGAGGAAILGVGTDDGLAPAAAFRCSISAGFFFLLQLSQLPPPQAQARCKRVDRTGVEATDFRAAGSGGANTRLIVLIVHPLSNERMQGEPI
jgi:hypothetical protein